jgi:hypothetical protein
VGFRQSGPSMRSSGLPQVLQPQPHPGASKKKGSGKPGPSNSAGKSFASTALAVPAACEAATAVETPEAASVGETYTTVEAATHAMAEAATCEVGEP